MKKNIIELTICIVLTIVIGVVGIEYISEDGKIYPETERKKYANSIQRDDINNEIGEVGAFSESITYIDDYVIKINTKQKGHPNNGSVFSTYCNISSTASVNIDYYFYKKNVDVDVLNYSDLEKISINKKEYRYIINENKNNATLYYKNDDNSYLVIVITGKYTYDEISGNAIGYSKVDKNLLNTRALKEELSFKITKNKE